MKRYLIVGDGAAGASAVAEIRARDPEGSITVLSSENFPHYYRPRLPDYIAGEVAPEKFSLRPPARLAALGVDLRLGETAVSIDPAKREARTDKSDAIPYDALLIAAGADAFLPPVPGNDRPGVFTLRSLADADAIAAAARSAKTRAAAVVGGGLLGLEAGRALLALGLRVVVVERADRLLPRQLDGEGAAVLRRALEGMGFSFRLGATAREITGRGAVEALTVGDGERLECGLALFSAGARPRLGLARSAGLEIGAAAKADRNMRSSVPGIWAAGDVAEADGRACGSWPVAAAQGKIAGASMAGDPREYVHAEPPMGLKVAGVSMASAGDVDAENLGASKRLVYGETYRKIALDGDAIKGAIFLGSTVGAKECVAAMNSGRRLGPLAEELDRPDFDFSRL